MHATFVVGYNPVAEKMASLLEEKANEVERSGYEIVSFSITNSGKAIILAKADIDPQER